MSGHRDDQLQIDLKRHRRQNTGRLSPPGGRTLTNGPIQKADFSLLRKPDICARH